jgi:hypothetical protein
MGYQQEQDGLVDIPLRMLNNLTHLVLVDIPQRMLNSLPLLFL